MNQRIQNTVSLYMEYFVATDERRMSNSEKDLSFHVFLRFFSLSSEEVEYNCGLDAGKQPQNCQKNVKNFINHASP